MNNRWIVQKRHDMLTTIVYSIIGLILVTGLVTLMNYAIYSNHMNR
jgi:hypothetical protein